MNTSDCEQVTKGAREQYLTRFLWMKVMNIHVYEAGALVDILSLVKVNT